VTVFTPEGGKKRRDGPVSSDVAFSSQLVSALPVLMVSGVGEARSVGKVIPCQGKRITGVPGKKL
jgi:hypothetical protein